MGAIWDGRRHLNSSKRYKRWALITPRKRGHNTVLWRKPVNTRDIIWVSLFVVQNPSSIQRANDPESPQFVNSIYLESLKRIEAFSYLMMLYMLILSLSEYAVRCGLQEDNDVILFPDKRKMKRSTQRVIYDIFYSVRIRVVRHTDKPWVRTYAKPHKDSILKVLKYLHIPEDTFGIGRRN